ncbi:MAG: hypothetical protein ACR2PI_00090 [Hyphomicrobiaceae bacterium]
MSPSTRPASVTCNGRDNRFPAKPAVVVYIDGPRSGYIEAAIDAGLAPNCKHIVASGTNLLAKPVVPMIANRPLSAPGQHLRNFDAFDVALNRCQHG